MQVSQPCVHGAIDTCSPWVSTLGVGVGVGIGPRLDENDLPDPVLGSLPKFSKTPLLLGPEATQSQQQPGPISMVGPVCLLKLRPFSYSRLLDCPFLISTFRRFD